MNQDVRIDREGLQNIRTGERQTMILADELEVSRFSYLPYFLIRDSIFLMPFLGRKPLTYFI